MPDVEWETRMSAGLVVHYTAIDGHSLGAKEVEPGRVKAMIDGSTIGWKETAEEAKAFVVERLPFYVAYPRQP